MKDDLLTADDLAERLRVQPSTVRRWHREGRIPAVHLTAKVIRFDYEAVVTELRGADRRNDLLEEAARRGLHLTTADKLDSQAQRSKGADHE